MSVQWYYVDQKSSKKNERKGPVESTEIFALIGRNDLTLDDYVWKKGFNDWMKIQDVDELKVIALENNIKAQFSDGPALDATGEVKIPNQIWESDEINPPDDSKGTEINWEKIDRTEKKFYVLIGHDRSGKETQYGPFSLELIEKLYRENRVNGKSYLWMAGMDNWIFLAEIPIFQSLFNEIPPTITEEEKRQSVRRPFVARMFFHDEKELFEGICRDISIGGMQVLVQQFTGHVGDRISLNVHPENTEYHFVAKGEVVRILEGSMGFSFRFTELDDDAKKAIDKYVESI